jgi:GT2 family glycosyltransferase/predicted Zn-dependent protease
MPLRYLFGPVSKLYAEQNLQGPRQAGTCLAFNADGDVDQTITPADSWEDVQKQLPSGWLPDLLVLNLPYTTVPECLETAPVPHVALAPDWNLLWHYYRACLPAYDLALTDTRGVELFHQEGIYQAHVANLSGCERFLVETAWPDGPRDIDILFVGNLNPAVQRERAPWLTSLARLGQRWRVEVRTGLFGESYARLLARSRIVFQFSARSKCGRRAFEAAAAGALIFQEHGNRELPHYFRDRHECVYYHPDELQRLLDYYLRHEEERRALAQAARARVAQCRFEDFWAEALGTLEQHGLTVPDSRPNGSPADAKARLWARCWQALGSSQYEDATLIGDLEKASRAQPDSAVLLNALGVLIVRQAQGRTSAPVAAEVAAEYFRRALACQPDYVLSGLNLAEALESGGQTLGVIEAARRTLENLHRGADAESNSVDGLPFSRGFDTFRMEWERAAWTHAGDRAAEARAKRDLIAWRLYTLLGKSTGELPASYEAALLRPDLPAARAALGVQLMRGGRASDAVGHLRQAVADNPLDREAAFTYFQALGTVGDTEGRRRLVEDRRALAQTLPAALPAEPWFAEPKPRGNELASIIILCCNQLDYTRTCLESLLRHTRPPYEIVLVDNASTDGTPAFLEEFRHRPGPSRVEILRNETNRGFPAGCNQGLARARGRYLVFLNNDTLVTAGWLDGLVAVALLDWPSVGLVGPVTNNAPDAQRVRIPYSTPNEVDAFAADWHARFAGQTLAVRRLTGFCLLVRREVLDRIGSFDERFGMGFFEDDDLCVRAREAGFRLLIAQDVFIHHFGNRTFQGMGFDTRQRLEENFERFRNKWGADYAAGYRLPPPLPPPETPSVPAEPLAVSAASEAVESLAGSLAAASSLPATDPHQDEKAAPPPTVAVVEVQKGKSLCMIVRNEEPHLPDCLRSVADLFDQIVIADTGSTDRTRDIAREFGARVVDFPWVDSFSAARNASLRHATGKWIMWLDADDRLDAENHQRLRQLLGSLGDELDAYAMKVRSALDGRRTAFRLLDQVRLFRNLPEARWDYRVHEQILPAINRAGGGVRWADVIIDHIGYQEAAMRQRKLERNLHLLELDYGDRPEDAFTLFNLGWTLMDLGRTDEACGHLEHALRTTSPTSSTLRKLYHLLTISYRSLKRPEDALQQCRAGLERFRDDGELLCEQGLMQRDQGDLFKAEQSWLRLLDARRGQYFASEEVGLRGYKTRQLLAEIYRVQGRLTEAEVQWRMALAERPDFEPAWQGLGEWYVQSGRWSDLEYLLQKLEDQDVAPTKLAWLRARGQIQRKELAAARRTLERVIAQDGQAIGPRVLLSQVLLQEGRDWAAAETALREVLILDPRHAESQHNLAVLLRRLGRQQLQL